MTYNFRDATSLAKWTTLSLYAQIAVTVGALISGYLEYETLIALKEGTFESQQAAVSAAEASDNRQGLVGLAQLIVLIASGFLILRWIHRANWNARALGAENMQFTPGWSIGWYFVPIANLWKPYQAMKEIWMASATSKEWQSQTVPTLLGLWWTLWIVHSMLGNASFRMSMRAKELTDLISANIVTIISDVAALPLCAVFLLVLTRIQGMQSARGVSNNPGVGRQIGDRMNDNQKVVLVVVITAIAAMLLFPPFHLRGMYATINLGYGFLFSPPSYYDGTLGAVDIGMLITQWLGVLILGGIVFYMFKDK